MLTDKQLVWVDEEVMRIVPVYQNEDLFCSQRKRTVADLRNLIREKLKNELMNPEQSTIKEINGVSINTGHPDVSGASSIIELQKLDMFANLPLGLQKQAYVDLWNIIRPEKAKEAEK